MFCFVCMLLLLDAFVLFGVVIVFIGFWCVFDWLSIHVLFTGCAVCCFLLCIRVFWGKSLFAGKVYVLLFGRVSVRLVLSVSWNPVSLVIVI